MLGIFMASRGEIGNKTGGWHIPWLLVSGIALSLSLMAGHPQTALFIIYAILAYGFHRAVRMRLSRWWTVCLLGMVIALGFGLSAVRMIPGFEFIAYISRGRQGFDWYANGFPFADLLTFILPNTLTRWSPLYCGIPALFLAIQAFTARFESARFWGYFSLSALVLSFGGSTILYDIAYLAAPGFAMFRGQERAAFLVAFSVATLAGLGVASLHKEHSSAARLAHQAKIVTLVLAGLASIAVILELALPDADLYICSNWMTHSVIIAAMVFVFAWLLNEKGALIAFPFLILLVAFDLFSVTKDGAMVSMPQDDYPHYTDLVASVPGEGEPFRVDGANGLWANNATLVGLRDIRGRNPMNTRANSLFNKLPVAKYYDLMCVAYVFTDWKELEVPSTIVDSTDDGVYNLHALADPAPCAGMVYQVMETPDEAQALGWISDSSFNSRITAVVEAPLPLALPNKPIDGASVSFTAYAAESMMIDVSTPQDGLLVLSEWYYPGWKAYDNGSEIAIIRVNAGQRGLALEAGEHTISMIYQPVSYRIGLIATAVSAMVVIMLAVLFRRRRVS